MKVPKLIEVLLDACKAIGKKNTIELLEGVSKKDTGIVIKNYIVVTTCSEYGVSPRQLNKNCKDENIAYANSIIAFLLTKHCNLSQSKIAEILDKKGRNSVSRYLAFINGLNVKFKKEAEILERIKKIEEGLETFKKSLKF